MDDQNKRNAQNDDEDDEGMMEGRMMKHNMMDDSTKTMDRSEHESHQQKK